MGVISPIQNDSRSITPLHRDSSGEPIDDDPVITQNRWNHWDSDSIQRTRNHHAAPQRPRRLPLSICIDAGMTDNTNETIQLLNTKQVSQITGVPEATLKRWRYERQQLRYIRIGHAVRYRLSDIMAWLDANTVAVDEGGDR